MGTRSATGQTFDSQVQAEISTTLRLVEVQIRYRIRNPRDPGSAHSSEQRTGMESRGGQDNEHQPKDVLMASY